jgi:hypothetical protein
MLLSRIPAPAEATNASQHLGIEGRAIFELPRADYRPRPLDDRTEVILRVESITPATGNRHRYEIYFMGLEPGDYSLAEFLMLPDGSRPDELATIRLRPQSLLPDDHNGQLTGYVPRRFPFVGGYRVFLILAVLLWVGGIIGFVMSYRQRKTTAAPVLTAPLPTFAERLRPLVEAAARGELSIEEKAQVERLLTGFWREKLRLPEQRMADALAELKAHTEAGALLRTLERWLHRREGASAEQISSLLAPYRDAPATSHGGAT